MMQETVIVVTRGESLLMESVEAGLRARGVHVYKHHPSSNTLVDVSVVEKGSVTVFDLDELSPQEVASLRECITCKSGTLLALNRERAVALRYRVDQVALTGLRDLLAGTTTSLGQAVSV